MAAPAVSNVVAGKPMATGGVLSAPAGSTLPTNATTALDAAYVALGYISEEGVGENEERSGESKRAWGRDVVKYLYTEFAESYTFTLIESFSADVLKEVYGADNVTTTPADLTNGTQHAVVSKGSELPSKVFVFEIKDGVKRKRIVIPNGKITTVGERTYVDGDTVMYPVTVEAFVDDNGAYSYHYTDDGKPTG